MDPFAQDWDNIPNHAHVGGRPSGRPHDTRQIKFFAELEVDPEESYPDGLPKHRVRHMIEIFDPETPNKRICREAKDKDIQKWPKQWKLYKDSQKPAEEGTMIEAMVWLGPARIADLKARGITTIEKLANVPDKLVRMLGGGMPAAVKQARWLQKGVGEELSTLRAEVQRLTKELHNLQGQRHAQSQMPMQQPGQWNGGQQWRVQ